MLGGGGTSLEVRVDGTVDGYERAMRRAESATRSYQRSIDALSSDINKLEAEINDAATKKLEAQHDAYDKVGRGMVVAGGAMLAGAGLAVKAAIDWESAWTGVQKTVSGTPEQMNHLEDQLRGLAKVLPATHQEIAATAEAAGQLGVKREDIAGFTKVMIEMGATTNLSADEAATAIAQFMNVMQSAGGDVDRIGATIVALGNKGASTEAEIVHMAQRLAGAGKLVGASEADVLGLASAMANLGIQSELGGGAMQRVLTIIYSQVKAGGANLQELADVAGTSAQSFASAWEKSPIQALDMLVQGLGRTQKSGGNVIQTLSDMGIKGTQNLQVMLRLAGSGDMLTKSLQQSNSAWIANNALQIEANKRFGTTAAKMAIARNQITDAAIDIGGALLPAVAGMLETFSHLVAFFDHLPGPIKAMIGPLTALMGIVLLLGGAMMMAVPKIAAFNAALASGNLTSGMQRAGNAVKGLTGALMGPWGLALGLGVTALGFFAAKQGQAAQDVDSLTATLDEQTGAVSDNSREWAAKKLMDEGALSAAKTLGLDLGTVTDAALGQTDALAQVNDKTREWIGFANASSEAYAGMTQQQLKNGDAAKLLQGVLGDTNGTLSKSRAQWEMQKEAMGGSADASKRAGGAAQESAGAQGKLGDAAGQAGGKLQSEALSAKQLAEALHRVNDAILGARAGARQYQQTLDETRKTLRDGVKTLNIHTQAGRENQAAMDAVASATLGWADELLKVDKTGRRSFEVMRQGRKDLFNTARQFGMTRDEAHAYVNQVLRIPKNWRTQFTTPGADESRGRARALERQARSVPQRWTTIFNAFTGGAVADVHNMVNRVNAETARINRQIDVAVNFIQHGKIPRQATGGPVIGQADGGAVVGPGSGTDDRVLRLLSNGEHVWTAKEVQAAGGHDAVEQLRREVLSGATQSAALNAEVQVVGRSLPQTPVVQAVAAPSGPMELTGQLHIPGFGPAYIRGIVRQEMDSAESFSDALAGRRG